MRLESHPMKLLDELIWLLMTVNVISRDKYYQIMTASGKNDRYRKTFR